MLPALAVCANERSRRPRRPSGVDLTFATYSSANSSSECQIQNSTSNLYLLVVLWFKHSQKHLTATGCECLNRTTSAPAFLAAARRAALRALRRACDTRRLA